MKNGFKVESISCPYCHESKSRPWAKENGFNAVKCVWCGLVYVNPRPILSLVREAVETGIHSIVEHERTAIGRRVNSKVTTYKKILSAMYNDVWQNKKPISWLDVGTGYGEVLEAVIELAPSGSKIEGLEPMKPKAQHARCLGLAVRSEFLRDVNEKYDYLSLIDVFSHIPDFREFIIDIKNVLKVNGELFLETGNIGDLNNSYDVPTELDLPDHLIFAGEDHIVGYLSEAGFSIIEIKRRRKDGVRNFAKNIIKKIMGRQVTLAMPYSSPYRSLMIRARLHSS